MDDVSFFIRDGETLGLVGETGCGKTTIGRTILKLTRPDSGRILFEGQDITAFSMKQMRPLRSRMQMIFQDLDAALNPKMRVQTILEEALHVHRKFNKSATRDRVADLLEMVALKKNILSHYPGELSGGEKRRVGIARSLAVGARFIVADEPTSALDVSIQAQVVNLLKTLQNTFGLSFLFISHDLRIVEVVSHKVAVMYMGKIVEMGLAGSIAQRPHHPYSRILWSSLVDKRSHEADMDTPIRTRSKSMWRLYRFKRPAAGCRFAPRCPVFRAQGSPDICTDPASAPELVEVEKGHKVACHFPNAMAG